MDDRHTFHPGTASNHYKRGGHPSNSAADNISRLFEQERLIHNIEKRDRGYKHTEGCYEADDGLVTFNGLQITTSMTKQDKSTVSFVQISFPTNRDVIRLQMCYVLKSTDSARPADITHTRIYHRDDDRIALIGYHITAGAKSSAVLELP
ncbi:hypothetical protein J6590_005781 [Homalodisca vitripennis]|nr:hypothetical protein J6590_005781 [Homalodisca vitripennis]